LTIADVVENSRTVVCCGSGGVGKTTLAAVLAMEAARRGRKAVVVTIDPARRLADALGLEELSNTPRRIEGDWPGELWALMLDTKSTFDSLVAKYATEEGQAERIMHNRFYRNISGALSGTQEYMAGEKLYELHEEYDFDLVVVDTPPSRNALDFLEAPAALTRFLDNRLYRMLMTPARGMVRAMNMAAQAFMRTVSRVVGAEPVRDALEFFRAFQGMEQGFIDRAHRVQELLDSPDTSFVLVASPRADTVDEARFFAAKLAESGLTVKALVINRVHPRFGGGSAASARARAETFPGTPLADLYSNLADFLEVASREDEQITVLHEEVPDAELVRVPFLESDVHDLDGMRAVGELVFAGT